MILKWQDSTRATTWLDGVDQVKLLGLYDYQDAICARNVPQAPPGAVVHGTADFLQEPVAKDGPEPGTEETMVYVEVTKELDYGVRVATIHVFPAVGCWLMDDEGRNFDTILVMRPQPSDVPCSNWLMQGPTNKSYAQSSGTIDDVG